MSLAENLRRIREGKKLSQAALAKLANVSQQSISRLESGVDLTSKKLPSIAGALGCQLADLDEAYSRIAPVIEPQRRPSASSNSVTARLGELFAVLLKSDEDVQIEAVRVLENVLPSRQRSRLTKAKVQ